ncbi:small, acid-soluble spore protein, alpha/beta type [Alkaliphilus crotonatoxidans]
MGKNLEKHDFTEELLMKYEIAEELGLIDKLKRFGWGELTAKETGRIGGLMTVRKKQSNKNSR